MSTPPAAWRPTADPSGTTWRELADRFDIAISSLPEPWAASLRTSLHDLDHADPLYAPTTFWQPGVSALLTDLELRGIERFKAWPSSAFFFYPKYSPTFTYAMVDAAMPHLTEIAPSAPEQWFRNHLIAATDANRDIDISLAQHDAERLPLVIAAAGESPVGEPPQRYRPFGADGPSYGKPYLNYLKILTAVSRHVDRPIRSVAEIGAGFGVLGEILFNTDPTIQYIDIDIPPLSVVAHHYLSTVFAEIDLASNLDLADGRQLVAEPGGRSACISSWQLPQVSGSIDLFVNAFSFQEMEPHVVANYAAEIARLGAEFVVSLNSRAGKPLKAEAAVGVQTPVTSDFIVEQFAEHGYEPAARLGRPAAPPQAELLVLRRPS